MSETRSETIEAVQALNEALKDVPLSMEITKAAGTNAIEFEGTGNGLADLWLTMCGVRQAMGDMLDDIHKCAADIGEDLTGYDPVEVARKIAEDFTETLIKGAEDWLEAREKECKTDDEAGRV